MATKTIDAATLIADLSAALPPGWSVTRQSQSVPVAGWHTNDGHGLCVAGTGPGGTFRVWFLPEDWVGIRGPKPDRSRATYWEGILLGRGYKSITEGPAIIQEALRKLSMQTPSLVNGGRHHADRIWEEKFAEADRKAQTLIKRHAVDEASFSEAMHSLVVLGIPAQTVLVSGANRAVGEAREFVLSALGTFTGPDVAAALGKAVQDPACTARCRKMAAMSLEQLGDPSTGPHLAAALATTKDTEAGTRIALALARIQYRAAGDAILLRMQQEANEHYQAEYATALATLGHTAAALAIAKLAKHPTFTADWALELSQKSVPARDFGMSLLRLTGPWSKPVDGIRIMLLGPKKPDGIFVILIENNSNAMIMVPELLVGSIIVDGKTQPRVPLAWNGVASLHVGGVWVHRLRSDDVGSIGGRSIHYEIGKLRSNTVTR